jgi:outer membrane protein assembly factor BamB
MFRYPRAANGTANITTPIFFDNKVFFTSAYDTGGGLVDLSVQNGEVKAKEIYFTRDMKNHHGGVVLVNGYLYGFNDSILTCLEWSTGKMMWRDRSVGKGAVMFADGHLYLLGDNNIVGLAEASPAGYKEKAGSRSRTRGSRAGRTRSSAAGVSTSATKTRWSRTTSRRSEVAAVSCQLSALSFSSASSWHPACSFKWQHRSAATLVSRHHPIPPTGTQVVPARHVRR